MKKRTSINEARSKWKTKLRKCNSRLVKAGETMSTLEDSLEEIIQRDAERKRVGKYEKLRDIEDNWRGLISIW